MGLSFWHGFAALFLPRHDESATDIAVLDEPFTVADVEIVGQLHGGGPAAVWDGDHHIDVMVGPSTPDLFREFVAHTQTGLVYLYVVQRGVRAGKIDVFENTWRIGRRLYHLPGMGDAVDIDKQRLARFQVTHPFETTDIQRCAFGSGHVFITLGRFALAVHHRANTVGVAESKNTDADDHGDHRIGSLTTAVHAF